MMVTSSSGTWTVRDVSGDSTLVAPRDGDHALFLGEDALRKSSVQGLPHSRLRQSRQEDVERFHKFLRASVFMSNV